MENQEHIHSFTHTDVPATCKDQGYTLHHCDCGYEYKDNYIPAGDHTFVVTEQKAPTCTEPGLHAVRCSTCGLTNTHQLPAHGHRWGDWNLLLAATCLEDGKQSHTCTCCGEKEETTIKATGHNLINSTKSATKRGVTEYFCKNCGQTVEIKKSTKGLKWAIAIVATVLVLGIAAAIAVPRIKLGMRYKDAKELIASGDYAEAYALLQECKGYKDSEELLKNFVFLLSDEITTSPFTAHYQYKYDEKGNQIAKYCIEDGEPTLLSTYEYDENGNKIRAKSKDEVVHEWEYDKNGVMIQEISFNYDNTKTKTQYNSKGNKTLVLLSDANNKMLEQTEYTYDEKGNCIQETFSYYANGPQCDITIYEYDDQGNLTAKIEDGFNVHKYEYNEKGQLTAEIAGSVKIRECEYNEKGQLTAEKSYLSDGENPENKPYHLTKYEYDKKGQLIVRQHYRNTKSTSYQDKPLDKWECAYDENGNQILIKVNNSVSSEWEYDENGNLLRSFERGITTEYKYDYILYLPS